jgi:hypothetical protein
MGQTRKSPSFAGMSVRPLGADIARRERHVRFVPILLQKSFWGGEQKFLAPLMRLTRDDVRDRVVSSKIDPGPSYWR